MGDLHETMEDRAPDSDLPAEPASAEHGPEVAEPEDVGAAIAATEAPTAPLPDFRDRWLRAEAELQNFRRRAQREAEEGRRAAEERVLLEMIAVIDDLERALQAASESGAPEGWTRGVELTVQRLHDYLLRNGVAPVDPAGEPFDPRFHEALLEVEAPAGAAPGAVVSVTEKGYRRGDRSLRAARVVVARAPAGERG